MTFVLSFSTSCFVRCGGATCRTTPAETTYMPTCAVIPPTAATPIPISSGAPFIPTNPSAKINIRLRRGHAMVSRPISCPTLGQIPFQLPPLPLLYLPHNPTRLTNHSPGLYSVLRIRSRAITWFSARSSRSAATDDATSSLNSFLKLLDRFRQRRLCVFSVLLVHSSPVHFCLYF